ncbi:hypothetical protein HJFPF1_05040 [Paramyrothecium foliicola]|nr:hypothetical protein HJFPF1_05040 [Paramyrothecium foliicola]
MATQDHQSEAEALDAEIAALQDEVASMRKALRVGSSTILSSASTQKLIRETQRSSSSSFSRQPTDIDPQKLVDRAVQQNAYIHQCLHRITNPVTAFKVRDPDPRAVDEGHVLGLRFEVLSRGQFLRPYYVMLNRPFSNSKHLRVHRHTVPPAIPLAGLAARFLPAPPRKRNKSAKQDLERFVRALRREIARYHNRLGVAADLRRGLGLHRQDPENITANSIIDFGIADIEAKQIKLTWADERNGRLVMDDDGEVVKFAVFDAQGRDWETAKELVTNGNRIEDVAAKLKETNGT